MTHTDPHPAADRQPAPVRPAVQWGGMLGASVALVVFLEWLRLPAALLLGPMIAAIGLIALGGRVRVAQPAFYIAQGLVGCLIVRSMPLSLLGEIAHDWPIFLLGVASVIGAAALLGWLLAHLQVLPGTTAIWGSSPGAATAMVLMAESYGADMRLVAFMQYLRVVCVAFAASLVSRIWISGTGGEPPAVDWFPAIDGLALAQTLGIALFGSIAGPLLRIPAGPLLVPIFTGIVLQDTGLVTIELPPWLLAISYALVGWSIGLRFTRAILKHAMRALPRVLGAVVGLIAICGAFAVVLVQITGVSPLTAYLATSPGGADSVAIIATASDVDVPFVMAMQTARFLVVLLTGPALARFIANRMAKRLARRDAGTPPG